MEIDLRVKYIIMVLNTSHLERLRTSEILDLSEFVVKENFKHHSHTNVMHAAIDNDIQSIYKEEMKYLSNSEIFVAKSYSGEMLGSIRVLKWNYIDVLPLQKIFGINPLLAVGDLRLNEIWHIGRFAIRKECRDIHLFKKLMVCAISPICKEEGNIAFAECDSKLLRILNLLGIKTTVIGESINYLGSETIPISMTYEGLMGFYNKYKHLVSNDVLTNSKEACLLPKSVVSGNQLINYSFV